MLGLEDLLESEFWSRTCCPLDQMLDFRLLSPNLRLTV